MQDNYHLLISKLDAFIRKYYKNQLIRGAIYAFTLSLVFFLLIASFEYFGHFNTTLRTILFYGFIGGFCFILGKFVAIPLLHLYRFGKIISHEQAALIIGEHFGSVEDKLLNVLQLKKQSVEDHDSRHRDLILAGIQQKATELKPIPFVSAINMNENKRYVRYAILPVFAVIIILFTAPSLLKDSTKRLINHNTYFEKPAPFTFKISNKDLTAIQQQDFQLDVELSGKEIPAEVFIEIDNNEFKLDKENITSFHYLFRNVQGNQTFRLIADGFASSVYTLKALPNPILMNFSVSLDYPAYLHKQNETLQNTGDLLIPSGTKVSWKFNTKNTEKIRMLFTDTTILPERKNENEFILSKRFSRNDSYTLIAGNSFMNSNDSIRYSISVIPDIYPSINVEQQSDSFSTKRTYFRGLVKDDYGFSKLTFNYRFLKAGESSHNSTLTSESLPITKNQSSDQFYYTWDLNTVDIVAGDEVEYFFEIRDNDGINGPKATKSQSQIFKAPTLKELADNTEQNNESIRSDLKESVIKARQLQKELNDLSKKLMDKKELSYEDKKKAEDLTNKQKELEKKLEDLKNKNAQKNRQEEEYKKVNEDIQKKQDQLQSILDQLKSPELQKLMEQLQQLMQNVDKSKMQEQISQMKMDNKDLQKELERAIELFKQMEFEQKLQDNIDKLNDLAKKEDDLSKKADDKNADSKDVKEKQDELNKKFDDFRKDLDELAKKNEELEKKNDLENTDKQEQDIQKEMENSSEQLEQSKSSKAAKSQKNAANKMKQLAQKMSKMQEGMQKEQEEEDMDALRALLENLLRLSFDQEKLMQDLRTMDINNPQYLKLSQQQRKLKDDAKMIEDSLFALSKRNVQIQSKVNQETTAINDNMSEALQNLEDRSVGQARSRQQFVMTSVNNLTLMLSEALQQMMQQMAQSQPANSSCNKPGKKKPGSSMAELRKMQEELNKNMQKMKESMKAGNKPKGKTGEGQQMSEQLAKMAAQQEFIRNQLDKYNQSENKDGKNSLGDLQGIADKMEETEKDIVNRMISDQTLKRQQEITTRLLESEKAEQEREQDQQRKSEEAKNIYHRNPNEFEEYKRLKLKEMELLKTVPPSLNTYFKQKVNDYFQSLDK